MTSEHAENPEFVPEWDVYRISGQPVTITAQQSAAIWHAVFVVERVRQAEGFESLWALGANGKSNALANLTKSRLLGRMLFEGKPPTRTRPPREMDGPSWWLLPGGDPFGDPAEHTASPGELLAELGAHARALERVRADYRALSAEVVAGLSTDEHQKVMRGGLPFCRCGYPLDGGNASGAFITHALASRR